MPEKDRVVFHIDCNAFFASVEEIRHPELKKVPMAGPGKQADILHRMYAIWPVQAKTRCAGGLGRSESSFTFTRTGKRL